MRRITMGLVALTACSSAPPDKTITLSFQGGTAPQLVAYRQDGDASWQTLAKGTSTFTVHGPYWFMYVCGLTLQYARTLSDPDTIQVPCGPAPQTDSIQVTGTMVQLGTVSLGGDADSSFTGEPDHWPFMLESTPGTYSLYAQDSDNTRFAFRRDVVVTGDVTLPTIDLDLEGADLATVPGFSVNNPRPAGKSFISMGVRQPHDPAIHGVSGGMAGDAVKAIPADRLGDAQQIVEVNEYEYLDECDATHNRSARRPFTIGDSTSLTLPDAIEDLSWTHVDDQIVVEWNALPTGAKYTISASGSADHYLDVSPAFLAETGTRRVTFETHIDGYQRIWAVPWNDYGSQFIIDDDQETEGRTTSVDQVHSGYCLDQAPKG